MVSRSIDTSQDIVACDVCGRTLLRGERGAAFIGGGERRVVCELCTGRATNEGWVREGAAAVALAPRGGDRARSLFSRLRQRFARDPQRPASHEPETSSNGHRSPPRAPATAPGERRRVHAIPTDTHSQTARALELFNASEHPRTIAGIGRSLGAPLVSVVPIANARGRISILVAWELCWYRYEVELAEDTDSVVLAEQGDELSELGAAPPPANATADEHGELRLASAAG
jgi:hypothetical protein